MGLIQSTKGKLNYHDFIFYVVYLTFLWIFSFSAFLEDLLYLVSSSRKLTKNKML